MTRSGMITCSEPLVDDTLYRSTRGALQHVYITRPNITIFVNKLSQFMQTPSTSHWKVVHHIVTYLKGTIGHCIMFRTNSFPIKDISIVMIIQMLIGVAILQIVNLFLDSTYFSMVIRLSGGLRNSQLWLDLVLKLNFEQ